MTGTGAEEPSGRHQTALSGRLIGHFPHIVIRLGTLLIHPVDISASLQERRAFGKHVLGNLS